MSFIKLNLIFSTLKRNNSCINQVRNYAKPAAAPAAAPKKKKVGKIGPIGEKKILPVVTDPVKLVNYVCGTNLYKIGEDIKVKQDSEYPEWLWRINIGRPLTLEELDPDTKQYWKRLRKMGIKRNNQLLKLRRF